MMTAQCILTALTRLGIDVERVGKAVGIAPGSPFPSVGFPNSVFVALWREAATDFGSDALGIRLAAELPVGAFGAIDFLLAASATVEEYCMRLCELIHQVGDDTLLRVERRPNGDAQLIVANSCTYDGEDASDELLLCALARRLHDLSAEPMRSMQAEFTRAAPSDHQAWTTMFSDGASFEQSTSRLVIARHTWCSSLRSAAPPIQQVLECVVRPGNVGFANVVAECILHTLPATPDEFRIAQELGLSVRALQRRLELQGSSFRALLDSVRAGEACRLLRDRGLRVQDVAEHLGFYEVASFSRAFRRWTGMQPAQWRKS